MDVYTLIEKYSDEKKTLIYVPQGISASTSFKEEIHYLQTRFNHDRVYLYQEVSSFANEKPRPIPVITFKNVTNGTEISLRFNFMLPNSSQASRSAYGLKEFTPNELSLVYYLELNKCYYLFTGDMMNSSVQFLPQDDFSIKDFTNRLEYVKIPHHSSKNTLRFVDYISGNLIDKQNGNTTRNLASVTTVFLKQGLPQKLVLDRYKDFSSYLASTDTGTKRYGCVLTEFDYNANMVLHKTFGNAKR